MLIAKAGIGLITSIHSGATGRATTTPPMLVEKLHADQSERRQRAGIDADPHQRRMDFAGECPQQRMDRRLRSGAARAWRAMPVRRAMPHNGATAAEQTPRADIDSGRDRATARGQIARLTHRTGCSRFQRGEFYRAEHLAAGFGGGRVGPFFARKVNEPLRRSPRHQAPNGRYSHDLIDFSGARGHLRGWRSASGTPRPDDPVSTKTGHENAGRQRRHDALTLVLASGPLSRREMGTESPPGGHPGRDRTTHSHSRAGTRSWATRSPS